MSAPIELLKRVPMFARLSDKELKTLAANFTERSFRNRAGADRPRAQGAAGFFVIESGEANVTVDGDLRRTLGPGDYFGEIALIDGGARTATDHRQERRQVLRVDALAVPPARRGARHDRLDAARGARGEDSRARALEELSAGPGRGSTRPGLSPSCQSPSARCRSYSATLWPRATPASPENR